MCKRYALKVFVSVLLVGIGIMTGSVVLAAECGKVAADLNPFVIKNADMPSPDDVKNATCGGTIATTIIARPRTLNPVTLTDVPSLNMTDRMHEFLLHGSVDEPTPGMAEAFEVKAVGDKGQSVTFTIRKGLKFANGDPVTAEDVRFTYENLIYPKDIATSTRDVIACGDGKLPAIKVDSVNKITFTCSVTTRTFVAFIGGNEILNKKKVLQLAPNVEKTPKDFNTALGLTTPPAQLEGIGAGPFILTKIDPASVAEFKRNPNFWEVDEKGNKLPYIDGYRILIAPTQGQETALAQFRNGQTDWLAPRPEDIALRGRDKVRANDFHLKIETEVSVRIQFTKDNAPIGPEIAVKNNRVKFVDMTVRPKAVIEKMEFRGDTDSSPEIVSAPANANDVRIVFSKKTKVTALYTHNSRVVKSEALGEVDNIVFDIAKGSQRGANCTPGGRVEFTLNTNVGNTLREEMIKAIAEDANKKLGLNIKAEPKDFAALVDQLIAGDYEAILIGLTGGIVPEGGANVYTCNGNLHFYNVDCPKRPTEIASRVDELYRRASATLKTDEARKIWDEVQLLIGEDQPLIQLVVANALFAYRIDMLKNHGRNPFATQDTLYCVNGKCRGG